MDISDRAESRILAHANAIQEGLAALKGRNFVLCISLLNDVIDADKNNWTARMAVALAHLSLHETFAAATHLRYVLDHCTDDKFKSRAAMALTKAEEALERDYKEQAAKRHYGAI
jgi:hypothetical protein